MAYKINVSKDGKTYNLEKDVPSLDGKKIGQEIDGSSIDPKLKGYKLKITGTSDSAGFPGKEDVDGRGLRRVLLTRGFGMKTRQRKEGEGKKRQLPNGFRQKKTVRGNTISEEVVQINCEVIEEGDKKLKEIFGGEEEEKEGEEGKEESKEENKDKGEKEKKDKVEKKEDSKDENKKDNKKEEENKDSGDNDKKENKDKGEKDGKD